MLEMMDKKIHIIRKTKVKTVVDRKKICMDNQQKLSGQKRFSNHAEQSKKKCIPYMRRTYFYEKLQK